LPSGEECSVNNDTVSSVNLLIIVMDCVQLSVVNKSEGFAMVLPHAKMALRECVARIETLKQGNCPMWKDIWKRIGECSGSCNILSFVADTKVIHLPFLMTPK
jgi:hypothetical protein